MSKSIEKLIISESENTFNQVLDMEEEAQPEMRDFLNGVRKSEFFKGLFERGFIEGIMWEKRHKDCKFVISV